MSARGGRDRASVVYGNILANPEKKQDMVGRLLQKYDLDRNGTMDFAEFRGMMDDIFERLGFDECDKLTAEEAEEKFRELDVSSLGRISGDDMLPLVTELLDTMKDRFVELEVELASVKERVVDECMDSFDTNKDGSLQEEEMFQLVNACCDKMRMQRSKRPSRGEMQEIFNDYDEDRNGIITKNELMHFLGQFFETLEDQLEQAYTRLQI